MTPETPSTTGWHRADIIAALRKKGSNLSRVGRSIGLSRHSMSWALMKPHPRANAAIAELIDIPMHTLWPQWFSPTSRRPGAAVKNDRVSRRESTPRIKKAA